ncbi:hypothetical protein HMF8227_02334 [Saliniradius amylolyticus]|uniref:Uncharacterized protein n=1 Tax=Saliniradius amylolyticus TaxID=2183582 RepID=A0A2S2E552_9ALTE|nr:hypothetical protein [Saliniradius amylolyticus]AWL12786.1 hypothetical protein HMF8227_02334 [Saliniradius amylolyticus]
MEQQIEKQQVEQQPPQAVISAAEFCRGVTVRVTGRFLIEQGLAERWYQLRRKALRGAKGIKNHRIQPDFVDELYVAQARVLGLIQ